MPDPDKLAGQYQRLVQEIKTRLAAIRDAVKMAEVEVDGKGFLHAEFAFIQLRYACELIALSSLWAHQHQGVPDKFKDAWHPTEIFKELEKSNEHCFPYACRVEQPADRNIAIIPRTEALLTRSELAVIYGRCGDALHRGKFGMFLKGKRKTYDLAFLAKSAESIRNLLHAHMIFIPDARVGIICFLGIDESPADVYTIVADGPFSSEPPPEWIGS